MTAIEVRGLTKTYGETVANEDRSFTVANGGIFGFLGPNGAGKTTCIRTLTGFQSPTDGTATVLGADVRDSTALRQVVPTWATCRPQLRRGSHRSQLSWSSLRSDHPLSRFASLAVHD